MKHQIMTVMLDAFLIINAPPSFCKNASPYFFHGAFAPSFIWSRRLWAQLCCQRVNCVLFVIVDFVKQPIPVSTCCDYSAILCSNGLPQAADLKLTSRCCPVPWPGKRDGIDSRRTDQCWNRVKGHRVNDFGRVKSGHMSGQCDRPGVWPGFL